MLELRFHKGDCEVRADSAGKPIIAGYAAVFNTWSQDLGGFIERVEPGAFDKTLREADVRALANHDPNWLLGRVSAHTLRLGADSGGVHYEIAVNTEDPDGRRALAKVERHDWDGSSFGFRTIEDDWDFTTAPAQRVLREVSLRDVGPCTFPAYLDTEATVRAALDGLSSSLRVPVDEVRAAFASGEIRSMVEDRIASGSTSLPLSARGERWNAGEARKTLRPSQYGAAHFYRDESKPADQITSYKLGFAEVRNGTLTAVWRGVTAAAQRLSRTQIPDADMAAVRAKIAAYYRKAARQYGDDSITPPWEGNSMEAKTSTNSDLDTFAALEARRLGVEVEKRADVESLALLVTMYQYGQWFIDQEDEPNDEPDRQAMYQILDGIGALMVAEAGEPTTDY